MNIKNEEKLTSNHTKNYSNVTVKDINEIEINICNNFQIKSPKSSEQNNSPVASKNFDNKR